MATAEDNLAAALLVGGGALAKLLLGEDTPENRRRIYHWHDLGILPTFRWAGQIASTQGAIQAVIAERIEKEPAERRRVRAQVKAATAAAARKVRQRARSRGE